MELLNRHKLFILGTILLALTSFIPRNSHGEEYQQMIDQLNNLNLSISNVSQSECLEKNQSVHYLFYEQNVYCCFVPNRIDCLSNKHAMYHSLLWTFYEIEKKVTATCPYTGFLPPAPNCHVSNKPGESTEEHLERTIENCNSMLGQGIYRLQQKMRNCQ